MIVGEEKCDPQLRVPCRGPRKAWRPRDGAVAGLLSLRRRPLASLRGAGRTRGRTWGKNVCFPVGREKTVLKWYVALRGACCVPRFISAGGVALKGVCVNCLGPVTK